MESIYLLIPIALLFTAIAIKVLFWAIDSKQFDDLDTAGKSILFEDHQAKNTPAKQAKNTEGKSHD